MFLHISQKNRQVQKTVRIAKTIKFNYSAPTVLKKGKIVAVLRNKFDTEKDIYVKYDDGKRDKFIATDDGQLYINDDNHDFKFDGKVPLVKGQRVEIIEKNYTKVVGKVKEFKKIPFHIKNEVFSDTLDSQVPTEHLRGWIRDSIPWIEKANYNTKNPVGHAYLIVYDHYSEHGIPFLKAINDKK